jgi:hypothetical protein
MYRRRTTVVNLCCTGRLAWIVIVAIGLVGCNSESSSLVKVEGQVLLDGKPVPAGSVVTLPDSGRAARGEIDSKGRFVLETRDVGPGADPGLHRVAVVALASTDPDNPEAPSKPLVPQRYTNPYNSGLSIYVKPGEANEVKLELTSEGPKRR